MSTPDVSGVSLLAKLGRELDTKIVHNCSYYAES
jgi:hypothetical protein